MKKQRLVIAVVGILAWGFVLLALAFSQTIQPYATKTQQVSSSGELDLFSGNNGNIVFIPNGTGLVTTPQAPGNGATSFAFGTMTTGPNQFTDEGSNEQTGALMREEWSTAPSGFGDVSALHVHQEALAGGTENETSWDALDVTGTVRTPGSSPNIYDKEACESLGDCQALSAWLTAGGGMSVAGEEALTGGRFQVEQDPLQPSGTIASISSNLLTLSSPSNMTHSGVGRYLVDTTASKDYTTGSIASISGAPPVVTGSGTSWSTLSGSLCFSVDSLANNDIKFAVPISTIGSNTSLTLEQINVGSATNQAWPSGYTTGSYHIFPCSQVTAVSVPNLQFTVASASNFAAGDTVEEEDSYQAGFEGLRIVTAQFWPDLSGNAALRIVMGGGGGNGETFTPAYNIESYNAQTGQYPLVSHANGELDILGGFVVNTTIQNASASTNPLQIIAGGSNPGIFLVPGTGGSAYVEGAATSQVNVVAFTSTPTFDMSLGNTQEITLTGNVTSSTLINRPPYGERLNFIICQDSIGGRSFVWPSQMRGAMTIGQTASKCSAQSFIYDGTSAFATSPGMANE